MFQQKVDLVGENFILFLLNNVMILKLKYYSRNKLGLCES